MENNIPWCQQIKKEEKVEYKITNLYNLYFTEAISKVQ